MSLAEDKIHIAIVDDHPIVIEGLQKVLEQAYTYVRTSCFTSGREIMDTISRGEEVIDIILLDITLPDSNGMDLCKQIKAQSPVTKILAFSNHNDRSTIIRMLQNGASGYLLKNADAQEVVQCINEAMEGHVALSHEVKEIMARPTLQDLKSIPVLTRREKEILKHIADGKTSAAIASELFLSPLTVETHRRNLMQKFGVKNMAALVRAAMESDLL